jgi:hypothetical protein
MARHFASHIPELIYNMSEAERLRRITEKNKIISYCTTRVAGWKNNMKTIIDYKYAVCVICHQSRHKDIRKKLTIEQWIAEHNTETCGNFDTVVELFKHPKKPIARPKIVKKVLATTSTTAEIPKDVEEEMETIRSELEEERNKNATLQKTNDRYSAFHTRLMDAIEDKCMKADKIFVKPNEYHPMDKKEHKEVLIEILGDLRREIDNGMDDEDED